jgi:Holliday junction resolvase RusA-like endonuclease
MPEPIKFTVYGEPVAQGRPRLTTIAGRARAFDPRKSRDYKQLVAQVAQQHAPPALLTGPLILVLHVFRPIPKGFNKRKRANALDETLRPTTRPDLKNILAGVEDALEGVLYRNDSQIVGYGDTGKWYGDPPRVEVELWREEDWRRAST